MSKTETVQIDRTLLLHLPTPCETYPCQLGYGNDHSRQVMYYTTRLDKRAGTERGLQ